ncbi:MAG: UDP-N-acetylenolpyruvoylglucosamine reductase, partial [Thermodesulfobacteriota bacterium]|nr:UDP-N-acetylenolpyruvoylglucosamine reductase [Thermodesulfobacteriota bacterium]
EEIRRDQIQTGYRRLKLPEGTLIIKAVFSLDRSTPEQVKAQIDGILARRLAGQPRGVKSAGCVFRNPPSRFAGRLIDQAGFKGLAVGRAWVSEKHANFIVHQGQATSGEVIELMERVRAGVRDRFGVELEPEIKIVGQDKEAGSA